MNRKFVSILFIIPCMLNALDESRVSSSMRMVGKHHINRAKEALARDDMSLEARPYAGAMVNLSHRTPSRIRHGHATRGTHLYHDAAGFYLHHGDKLYHFNSGDHDKYARLLTKDNLMRFFDAGGHLRLSPASDGTYMLRAGLDLDGGGEQLGRAVSYGIQGVLWGITIYWFGKQVVRPIMENAPDAVGAAVHAAPLIGGNDTNMVRAAEITRRVMENHDPTGQIVGYTDAILRDEESRQALLRAALPTVTLGYVAGDAAPAAQNAGPVRRSFSKLGAGFKWVGDAVGGVVARYTPFLP